MNRKMTFSFTLTLGPGDALSFDLQQIGDGVRVVVESDSPKVRGKGIVFDHSTQRISSFWILDPID